MTRIYTPGAMIAALFLFVSGACKNEPAKTVAAAPKVDTIEVQPVSKDGAAKYHQIEGTVNWSGKKSVGDAHHGTLKIGSGEMLINNGKIVSGTFTIDMNSLTVADIQDAGERRDLESHLKSADFFDAAKFPEARFVSTEILPSNNPAFNTLVVGDLTIKGKTNSVNLPLQVTVQGDDIKVESPTFPIQRTLWGVNFRSGILGTAKDKMIDDNILLSLTLRAKKD